MIICQNKLGLTEYIQSGKKVYCTYKGRITYPLAIEHLENILAFYDAEKRDVKGVLIDVKDMYGSYVKLLSYMTKTFYPAISNTSVIAQAIILKDDVIVNHLTKRLILISDLFPIKSRIFFSQNEAENWLQQVIGD